MPTTSVPSSPHFCFRSTESFIFFLSINKYLNYIYLIDLCCVGAEKAVQVLIEMEDVWNFSPCLAQWGAHPGNQCRRGSVSPISRILAGYEPLPSFEGTERINTLQNEGAPLMSVFEAYGDMAVNSFSRFLELSAQTEELVRSVSEWIFLVDMVCDYADDYKDGTYNGFKTEGLTTFSQYFDAHYREFLQIARRVTGRLMSALMAVKDGSRTWNTLYKIISHATETVIQNAILGKDVEFHYFKDLFERIGTSRRFKKDIKRLGIHKDEKG